MTVSAVVKFTYSDRLGVVTMHPVRTNSPPTLVSGRTLDTHDPVFIVRHGLAHSAPFFCSLLHPEWSPSLPPPLKRPSLNVRSGRHHIARNVVPPLSSPSPKLVVTICITPSFFRHAHNGPPSSSYSLLRAQLGHQKNFGNARPFSFRPTWSGTPRSMPIFPSFEMVSSILPPLQRPALHVRSGGHHIARNLVPPPSSRSPKLVVT